MRKNENYRVSASPKGRGETLVFPLILAPSKVDAQNWGVAQLRASGADPGMYMVRAERAKEEERGKNAERTAEGGGIE